MQRSTLCQSLLNRFGLWAVVAGLAPLASLLVPSQTENAAANGDTRTLTFYHVHTNETTTVAFRVNGIYDTSALEKLNWFLRDWRRNEPTKMDPRLFDVIWEVYRETGSNQPIRVLCGYRSPETNAMLHRRSRGVAEFSQHMLGKAMDLNMPDMAMQKVRDIAMRLQRGGVGYYPTSGTPFVHIDVGSVRYWPRISREEMARIFPDGKTVDIPADGRPMPRYQEALAEIEARGGSAYSATAGKSKSLFAMLFGGGEDDGETSAAASSAPSGGAHRSVAMAYAGPQAPVTANTWHSPFAFLWGTGNSPAASSISAAARTPDPAKADTGAKVQVAEADTGRASDGAPAAAVPVPPPRPADLPGSAAAGVPVPPPRPLDVALLAEAQASDSAATAAVPKLSSPAAPIAASNTAQKAVLPQIITEGGTEAHRGPALAFAEVPEVPRPSAAAVVKTNVLAGRRSDSPRRSKPLLVAARIDRANFRALTASAPTATATAYAALGAGSALAPLRPAARGDAEVSLFGGTVVAAHFVSESSTDPESDRFTGSAVQKLSFAGGFDSSPAGPIGGPGRIE